jgi:hypothetical protein
MADLKISQLTAATTPLAGTEVLPIVQSGSTKKVTVASLTAGRTIQTLGINDTNDKQVIAVSTTASAVNYLTVANAAASGSPTISATGTDTNINITLTPKGTGEVYAPNFHLYKASAAVFGTVESDNGQSAFIKYRSFGDTWSAGMSWSDSTWILVNNTVLTSGTPVMKGGSTGVAINTTTAARARIDAVEDTTNSPSARFGSSDNASWNIIYQRGTYTSVEFGGYNNASGAKFMAGGSGGVQLANGATSWSAWSDETMKTDMEPITGALAKVKQLRTVIGRYKTDDAEVRRSFFIAQDFQKVFPVAVNNTMPDGKLGLNYTDALPLLAAAINELSDQVAALKV